MGAGASSVAGKKQLLEKPQNDSEGTAVQVEKSDKIQAEGVENRRKEAASRGARRRQSSLTLIPCKEMSTVLENILNEGEYKRVVNSKESLFVSVEDTDLALQDLSREKVDVCLKYSKALMQSNDLNSVLAVIDSFFFELFGEVSVVVHLNPEYAANYARFLRAHARSSELSCNKAAVDETLKKFEKLDSARKTARRSSRVEIDLGATKYHGAAKKKSQGGLILKIHDNTDAAVVSDSCEPEVVDKLMLQKTGASVARISSGKGSFIGCPIYSSGAVKLHSLQILANKSDFFDQAVEQSKAEAEGESVKDPTRTVIAVCILDPREEAFTEEDEICFGVLCSFMGPAIERSCVESDLFKHLEHSRMMLRMSETLNSTLDSRKLIASAIVMLREALFAERGSMYLVDDTKSPPDLWTMVTGNQNDCETLRELHIPFGKGIAGHVAVSHKIELIPDAYKDPRFNPEVDRQTGLKTTSMLCIPVFSSARPGELVAVIQMVNKRDTEGGWTAPFDSDDVEILETFSGHVSVAIANASETAANKFNEYIANDLLHKMFPSHIIEKLKLKDKNEKLGHQITKTVSSIPQEPIVEKYPLVHVFFSDIVSFTTLSMTWEPYEVVNMLNEVFTHMDFLSAKHHVYKIETIGDAYVACTNLPFMNEPGAQESARHAAENLCKFALEAQEFLKSYETAAGKRIEIRCGIHCGPCFGGVVGLKMPRFCLMGDTMNTASRMESTGTRGRVHISDSFKRALDDGQGNGGPFTTFNFEDLGTMDVKGKGEMRTWFLNPPVQAVSNMGEQEEEKETA